MDEHKFEQRMERLKRSYDEITPFTDPSDMIQEVKRDRPTRRKSTFQWSYVAGMIGVVLIGAVLFLQMTLGDQGVKQGEQSGEEENRWQDEVENLQDRYELLESTAMDRLGITQSLFNKTEMSEESKMHMKYIESIPKRDVSAAQKREWFQRAEEEMNQRLTTPDVMMKTLTGPLSAAEAEVWVDEFVSKEKDILPIYEEVLNEHEEFWRGHIEDGQINMTEFNQKHEDDPTLLSKIRQGMFNNGVTLTYDQKADRVKSEFDDKHYRVMVNPDALPNPYESYLLTRFDRFIQAGVFTGSWNDAAVRLIDYEKMLIYLSDSSRFRKEVEHEYDLLYQSFTRGTTNQPIFDDNGGLKQEVKDAYRYIQEEFEGTVTAGAVREVYEELEQSRFIKPERWVQHTPVILSKETEDMYEGS